MDNDELETVVRAEMGLPPTPKPPSTFAAALAAAQATMTNPVRDKENPHFKSRYTSLAAVRDAVVPVLAAHGIATILEPRTLDDGRLGVFCHLLWGEERHTFGPVAFGVDQRNPQVAGSAATYGERYLLSAVGAVAADDDDDGNAAADASRSAPAAKPSAPNGGYGRQSGQARPGSTQTAAPASTPALATEAQQRAVFAGLARMEGTPELDTVAFNSVRGPVTWAQAAEAAHAAARGNRQIPLAIARPILDALDAHRVPAAPVAGAARPRSGVILGKKKEAIEDMDVSGLEWWERKLHEGVDDPKYGAKNERDLVAVRAELDYRGGGPNEIESGEIGPDEIEYGPDTDALPF